MARKRYHVENWVKAEAPAAAEERDLLQALWEEQEALIVQLDCTAAMLVEMMGVMRRYYWKEWQTHPYRPDRLAVGVLLLPDEEPEFLTEEEWIQQAMHIQHQQAGYRAEVQWPLRERLARVRREIRELQPVRSRPRTGGHFAQACAARSELR